MRLSNHSPQRNRYTQQSQVAENHITALATIQVGGIRTNCLNQVVGNDKMFRYTVGDGNAIHVWVREHYSSSGELISVPELVDNDATGTRPSQWQREPSRKATSLQPPPPKRATKSS